MSGTLNSEANLERILTVHEDLSKSKCIVGLSSLGGRGLFATEAIKCGDLIFNSKPLVTGPRADSIGESFCTVCNKISGSCLPCSKCPLLVCSDECKKSNFHNNECRFITKIWIPKPSLNNYSETLSKYLIYLRFLLLTNEQKSVLNIFQRSKTKNITEEFDDLLSKYVIPNEHVEIMSLTSSVLRLNSFRISSNSLENKIPLRGLYCLSAFLNHSCLPNTRNVFSADYKMNVYATKDIEIGEELLTSYTGLLWSTPARRLQLYKMKGFWCFCKRCEDKNEMGTKLASLKCLYRECVGILLPVTPTHPKTDWVCDNCNNKVNTERISAVQSILGSLVGTLNLDEDIRLESFVLERLANFIPYSSHIFVELRMRLALKIGFAGGLKMKDLSESRLALKESLCRGTLRTLAALGAGDAHLRGLLLYHLHGALAERARRCPDQYEELKTEIERTIDQAYQILRGDISAPPDLELRHRYLGPGCDKPQEERFFILDA